MNKSLLTAIVKTEMVITAVIVFVLSIIIAHIFAPRGYNWKAETVSRLADPEHSHSWLLRAGMIAYGLILIASTNAASLTSALISVYGLGVIITGLFTVKKHERIHMLSIYSAGAALVIAMFIASITGSLVSIICLAVMLGAELLFNIKALAKWRGLSQRIVHLSTLIWLTVYSTV